MTTKPKTRKAPAGKTASLESFLEQLECSLIQAEDAAARGVPGEARRAAALRVLIDDPAWRPFMVDVLETLKLGKKWGNA